MFHDFKTQLSQSRRVSVPVDLTTYRRVRAQLFGLAQLEALIYRELRSIERAEAEIVARAGNVGLKHEG